MNEWLSETVSHGKVVGIFNQFAIGSFIWDCKLKGSLYWLLQFILPLLM